MNIPIRFHPRVIAALGSQLVTNDIVALLELVKNSYDAMATRVDVRIRYADSNGSLSIEVEDDGTGMSRKVIEDVWCVIATPYRTVQPIAEAGGVRRRVSGEKGLGRLSAARLGKRLVMITQPVGEPCWRVDVTWADLAKARTIDQCTIAIRPADAEDVLGHRGTLVRILDLNSAWTETQQAELREQLSRLVSPFEKVEQFGIWLTVPMVVEPEPVEVRPPEFLSRPPYIIKGRVDDKGRVTGAYSFSTPDGRKRNHRVDEDIRTGSELDGGEEVGKARFPSCGAFRFEIRGWDIDTDSMDQLAERFELGKSAIKSFIRNFRGISVYRDGVLVLPKTDVAKDWLGLDLRRVSRVGERMSTSQLVGYVSIGADANSAIVDTSDREGIEENQSSSDFKTLIKRIVGLLEKERARDREQVEKEPIFNDLFAELSAAGLLTQAREAAEQGRTAGDVLSAVEDYDQQVQSTIGKLQKRLFYYSRLASLGVLSAIIVHEVRNQTIGISRLNETVHALMKKGAIDDERLEKDVGMADASIRSLERLAERFAPLASRALRTRRRDSVLEAVIGECVQMREGDILRRKIAVDFPRDSATRVAIDPGELLSILLNLLDNALYWIASTEDSARRIRFGIHRHPRGSRIFVQVDDSGPGIRDGDEERIFWPGVTRKPEGLGMGLTVASELVSQHGGRTSLMKPGRLGGASFRFDLPLARRADEHGRK